jgi:GNAT superfamily N-acetyltransferase
MTRGDLPFADSVRALAGWNQTPADWDRFLASEPDGCFLAEWNGVPAGTATTTFYGPDLAWIGMVLVHPDYRRRGIGRTLLETCVEHLRERGARCLKLDATPLGKKVYDELGFKDEWTLTRWVCRIAPAQTTPQEHGLRTWRATDADRVESLDVSAFGISRQPLLLSLAQQSHCALVLESSAEGIVGYGLLRPGSQALYLGPVVARSADAGLPIVEALVARSAGQMLYLDIPDVNAAAVAWAKERGCTEQRRLTRMFLGENLRPGDPHRQFALAGPEIG